MTATPTRSATHVKTPTLGKGPAVRNSTTDKAAEGMIFVFALSDMVTESYISHDLIFKAVSGFHYEAEIITGDMIASMAEQVKKVDPTYTGLREQYTREDMNSFLYNYTSCMESCGSGQASKGGLLVRHYF